MCSFRILVFYGDYRCINMQKRHDLLNRGVFRAENGTRTRDPNLGKVMLYQLSYFRKNYFVMFFSLSLLVRCFIVFYAMYFLLRDFLLTFFNFASANVSMFIDFSKKLVHFF